MMTAWAVLGGFVLDAIFGDPAWLPHPVVYMGKAISRLEKFLRARLPKTPQGELLGGAVLAGFSVNLKRTLACSSMSQIGFILTGIAMGCLLGEENALAARGALEEKTYVLYISPLKALGNDIEANLRRPLAGIMPHHAKGFHRLFPLWVCFRHSMLGLRRMVRIQKKLPPRGAFCTACK